MLYSSLADHETGKSLSSSAPPGFLHRYKKPLVFLASVASIAGIVCLIVFVLLDYTGRGADPLVEKYPYTLDSVFNSSLVPQAYNFQWDTNGTSYIYQDRATGDWYRYLIATNESLLIVTVADLTAAVPGYTSVKFSPDGTLLLASYNVSAVWRHSFLASYQVFNIASKQAYSLVAGDPQLQNVVWNPAIHQVAYVQNYNIYIVNVSTPGTTPVAVTDDGNFGEGILNGIQSWVYEEEIFSDFSALWWSTDGTLLAYLRFNESQVPVFEYTIYSGSAYPTEIPLKYPKAGYTNPSVRLHVFDVNNGSAAGFPYLEFGAGGVWEYVASVQWRADNTLWIQQLNRYQNSSSIQVLSKEGDTWLNTAAYSWQSTKWIDIFPLAFYQGTLYFYNLAILPNDGFYHIVNIQSPQGQWTAIPLTSGNFDVISINGFAADSIYFTSTPPIDQNNPIAATLQHIYKFEINTSTISQVGQGQGVYTANFSPSGEYFVVNYQGPGVPQYHLVATNLSLNITLEDNAVYKEIISHYNLPTKEFITIPGEAGQLSACYKTPYNPHEDLPLIIDVYAGPGTQKCRQTHDVAANIDAYLSTQGFMIASIDGRGTGRRGLEFLQATYRQLGLLEMADQRTGAKELGNKLANADKDRIGIWGWSYGGFMAAHAMAGTSSISDFKFKTGVSVAPVSSWIYYDSVYTERYMSTPADNPAGYNETSVIVHAPNTVDDTLLLMHGTGDDNVHFQNTVELANAYINSNVQFSTMFYPNANHAINNGNQRRFLYEKLVAFFTERL